MGCGRGIRGRIDFQRKTTKGLIDGHKLSFFSDYGEKPITRWPRRYGMALGLAAPRAGGAYGLDAARKAIPRSLG